MILIIWEYEVEESRRDEFISHYSATGKWVDLFRNDSNYQGTELAQDTANPARYVTVDRWTDNAAYERFKAQFRVEYEKLDRACEEFTKSERCIGVFEVLP